jgi:5-methylcytosine-specific restriction endonuclease McrA
MSRSPLAVAGQQARQEQEDAAWQRKAKRLRVCRCGDPLPKYKRACSFCILPVTKIRIVDCAVCGRKAVVHGPGCRETALTCSPECSRKWKAAKLSRRANNRKNIRRTQTDSDITPDQEAAMRLKVRKCPMPGCGVWMTGKPGLLNSKELDHILPINQGGTHTHGNVRIICRGCNRKRPRDGSDYTGPLTLWAQVAGVSVVGHKKAA